MTAAADVPNKYDLVIAVSGGATTGYVFDRTSSPSAEYGISPTFVPRTNTQGDYGDNQQDFWMTFTQDDWSLGEQRKHQGRTTDEKREYWMGTNIDVETPGQVSMRPLTNSRTFAAAVSACCQNGSSVAAASTTNLYSIDLAGSITDLGAHGLGGAPSRSGAIYDLSGVIYLSGGGLTVRRYSGGFTTFSANGADAIAFTNNVLFGFRVATADIVRWDTAGTLTSRFTFQGTNGAAQSWLIPRLLPFGGKILVAGGNGVLYSYDDSTPAATRVWRLDPFSVTDMVEVNGIAYISGFYAKTDSAAPTTNFYVRPAIFYYTSTGTTGLAWKANGYTANSVTDSYAGPALAAYQDGILFTDDTTGNLMFHNPATGSVSSVGTYTVAGSVPLMAGLGRTVLHTRNQTTAYQFPNSSTYATSSTVISSLVDFDSSLVKLFRGIKVDFDAGTDGNGGTVDIAYRVGDVDGAYTTLQTGATSATEYTLSNITGTSLSVKVTLNKGTSTAGPVLKKVAVRAVPQQQTFKIRTYRVDMTGKDGRGPVKLRDGTDSAADGRDLANALLTALGSSLPLTITDRLGTFTGVPLPEQSRIAEIRPDEYVATLVVREV